VGCYLLLLQIVKQCTFQFVSTTSAAFVAALVNQHHCEFKRCYPGVPLTLTSALHVCCESICADTTQKLLYQCLHALCIWKTIVLNYFRFHFTLFHAFYLPTNGIAILFLDPHHRGHTGGLMCTVPFLKKTLVVCRHVTCGLRPRFPL